MVVFAGGAFEHGYWGEIMSSAAKAKGLAGLVIDACVRDGALLAHRIVHESDGRITRDREREHGFGKENRVAKWKDGDFCGEVREGRLRETPGLEVGRLVFYWIGHAGTPFLIGLLMRRCALSMLVLLSFSGRAEGP